MSLRKLNSCLINAGGAGYGKSVLLLKLFDNDNDVILVPQHENRRDLISKAKDGPEGATPGSAGDLDAEASHLQLDSHYGTDDTEPSPEIKKKIINERIKNQGGDGKLRHSGNFDFIKGEYKNVDEKIDANKTMMTDSTGTSKSMNVNNANSVSNSQTSNQSNVTNIASNDVHNNKNIWVNQIA